MNRPWPPEDDAAMRSEYPVADLLELGARLGRSRTAIYLRSRFLGISRPHPHARMRLAAVLEHPDTANIVRSALAARPDVQCAMAGWGQ